MSVTKNIFERIEKKYYLKEDQYNRLIKEIRNRLSPDEYGKSTINSLYFDTEDYRMIRQSIDAKVYKEKLRLRSYGVPDENSTVFLEIKKKYKGIVYKRRVSMTLCEIHNYIDFGKQPFNSQIMNEIDYLINFYIKPKPKCLISYEREAYYCCENPDIRLTFDSDVRYRADDLLLEHGSRGKNIIENGSKLMEIKTCGAMPFWLSSTLDRQNIFPSSFSKYGTAYADMLCKNTCTANNNYTKGELEYA